MYIYIYIYIYIYLYTTYTIYTIHKIFYQKAFSVKYLKLKVLPSIFYISAFFTLHITYISYET